MSYRRQYFGHTFVKLRKRYVAFCKKVDDGGLMARDDPKMILGALEVGLGLGYYP